MNARKNEIITFLASKKTTQAELAKLFNASYESVKRKPDLDMLDNLCTHFNVISNELLGHKNFDIAGVHDII